MQTSVRFYEIDLFRFVAAFFVMLMHYTFLSSSHGSVIQPPLYPSLGEVLRYGYLGVELFFLISGFVILMTAEKKSPLGFVISRLVRLYPAYWICCTVTFLVMWLGPTSPATSVRHYLANLTMVAPAFGSPLMDGVYWSLLVEIRFYFLIFLVAVSRQLPRIEWFLWGWFLVSIAVTWTPWKAIRPLDVIVLGKYSGYFIAGALAYILLQKGPSLPRLALFVLCYPYALFHAYQHTLYLRERTKSHFSFWVIAITIGVFFLAFLAVGLGKTTRLRFSFWLSLGLLTYPLYLLHNVVGVWLLQTYHHAMPLWVWLALLTFGALGLSYVVHLWGEKPLAKKLESLLQGAASRFLKKKAPEAPTPPEAS